MIWGDLTTNRLASTAWSNIYRVTDTTLTTTNRPIMADIATIGTTLAAGTYWLDWTTDGSAVLRAVGAADHHPRADDDRQRPPVHLCVGGAH